MHKLSLESLDRQCRTGEVWSVGTPPKACIFLKPQDGGLSISKLTVSQALRRQGIARQLVELAETRAARLGLDWLELETRIELIENHMAFTRLGFEKTAEAAHQGYDRPTYIVMRKPCR